MHLTVERDVQGLARRHVARQRKARAFQRHRFAGHHDRPVGAVPEAQRPDAVRVAERQQAAPGDQCHHGVGASHALVHAGDGGEHRVRGELGVARGLPQLVRQHAQQHLGIALGVDVAVVGGKQFGLERRRVGQVAVVHQHQAERGADVEGLRLFLAVGTAGGRVTHLAQPGGAGQRAHVAGAEHVAHHAPGLVHEELALLLRDDARGVLPAMLQQQQGVVNQLVDGCVADNADDAAHGDDPAESKMGRSRIVRPKAISRTTRAEMDAAAAGPAPASGR